MSSKGKVKNQDPISKEDLYTYMSFVLTRKVKDQKHAKDLRRLARRTTTLSDVTAVVQTLLTQQDQKVTQLMDVIQVQQRVLEKLGATEDMFQEAQDEYNEAIKEMQEQLQKQAEEAVKEKAETEAETEQEEK